MDLIERYLGAVGPLLPRGQRADITAELRDVLMNRREEQEERLGRSLNRDEEADLLRGFGHPIRVAGRYGPQRSLIGPELYPIFIFVLKIVLAIIVGSALVTGAVNLVFNTASADQPGPAIVAALAVWWNGSIVSVGVLTIVFAIFEHTGTPLLDKWDPRGLPARPRRRREGWFDHVAAIVAQVVALLWWIGVIQLWNPVISLSGGGHITLGLAPALQALYWPVIGLSLANIVVQALKLAGQRPLASSLDLAAQVAVVALAAVALRSDQWVTVTTSLPAAPLTGLNYGINLGVRITLYVVIAVAAGQAIVDVWRLARREDRVG